MAFSFFLSTEKATNDNFFPDLKAEQSRPQTTTLSVSFVRPIDGDTSVFLVHGKEQKVRYLLIDTPETVKVGTPIQPFWLEASTRTKELLLHAKEIQLEIDQTIKYDRYGRLLAYVFVDGKLVQETLVREGLARIAFVKDNQAKYLQTLEKTQEEAKNHGLGIWSIPGYVTEKGFK
ncbi:thermonuclease family protein [Enterococcus faecalis]|uniref:thermonuclease family protein n=1 Tax=Enterococcus faecalis TaxID=1351 RepID=UPI00098D5493|nr:thermonuclease family protein [Enterococcus faecalis]EGO2510558.1 thermonuclease family protein [Enterococcus faecalis]EGO5060667.1 thermonuclease family protein [Enterococcus faecalis]EHB6442632.1 thermonuclease family protein [Enterococcus faecalis]EHE8492822.1 thermonuclease family protein [Enterococcus faecalis]EHM3140143.1 thermonuclease family protein [Enterococcus faecalis]